MLVGYRLAGIRGGKVLYRDVSFTLHAGGALLLLGRNGSGKSTLLETIAGFRRPNSGVLTWQGQPLDRTNRMDKEFFKCHWVDCRQDGILDGETPLEHAEFWGRMYNSTLNLGETAIRHVGLREQMHLNSENLSVGQRRRMSLSRYLQPLCLC